MVGKTWKRGEGKERKSKKTGHERRGWEHEIREEQGGRVSFFLKFTSGWQAARGIQPKNLFNVCFTG